MKIESVKEALARISLGPSFESLHISFHDTEVYDDYIYLEAKVPDRLSGEMTEINIGVETLLAGDEADLIEAVYQKTKELILHELAENFRVDGKLLHDPHTPTVVVRRPPAYLEPPVGYLFDETPTMDDYTYSVPLPTPTPLKMGAGKRGRVPKFLTMLMQPRWVCEYRVKYENGAVYR